MKYEGTKEESHSVRARSYAVGANTVLHILNNMNMRRHKANDVRILFETFRVYPNNLH